MTEILDWKRDEDDMSNAMLAGEMVSLAIKAGRRASYDLKHACSWIEDPHWQNVFYERATMWLKIFDMNSGMKDYTHSLHKEIERLEDDNERLKKLLKENGIDDPLELPF